jgi:hypothetical protein
VVERGLGSSLPLSLRAWDSGVFEEMKYLFSIVSEVRKGGKSPKCLSLTTQTGRGLGLPRHVRSVAAVAEARGLGFCTGASDHLWDQRIWPDAQRVCSSHDRSDAVARPVTFDQTRPVMSGP